MAYRFIIPSITAIGILSHDLSNPKRSLFIHPMRCETVTAWPSLTSIGLGSSKPQPEPYERARGGATATQTQQSTFSPMLYRQVSTGSFLGLVAGFAVGKFSKSIGLVLGSLLLLIEFLASRGLHVVPYSWLQKLTNKVDVKGLVTKNMAFKASFGASFAIAALYN
ncbi:uncharacterized protein LAJ45_08616 [Morchella importuna]|uniref:uncharacterized protein n=1 Tax=Morchella importuna TaxID=1174673 RepID=UPI001E8D0916|nr:uncharacterized protein LAJ45_08616 [Morchella importuna]KAH8147459.1 hypothetical protein LAJ45_08616 [Morchella importuna]